MEKYIRETRSNLRRSEHHNNSAERENHDTKSEGATNKTYQESVAASECSRQHTRIWLDRSLDCILHSTNIETPCAQLNSRQRGGWNIEFAELNRRKPKKKGIALAKSLRYKKKKQKEGGEPDEEPHVRIREEKKNIDTMHSARVSIIFGFAPHTACSHYVAHFANCAGEWQFFASTSKTNICRYLCVCTVRVPRQYSSIYVLKKIVSKKWRLNYNVTVVCVTCCILIRSFLNFIMYLSQVEESDLFIYV